MKKFKLSEVLIKDVTKGMSILTEMEEAMEEELLPTLQLLLAKKEFLFDVEVLEDRGFTKHHKLVVFKHTGDDEKKKYEFRMPLDRFFTIDSFLGEEIASSVVDKVFVQKLFIILEMIADGWLILPSLDGLFPGDKKKQDT